MVNEESKIKYTQNYDYNLKKEISLTNVLLSIKNNIKIFKFQRNKEKIKLNLMTNSRKLHGIVSKMNILVK